MQDDLLIQWVDIQLGQNIVMQEFDTVQNPQPLPEFYVCLAQVIGTGPQRVSAGSGIDDHGIFARF